MNTNKKDTQNKYTDFFYHIFTDVFMYIEFAVIEDGDLLLF